MARALVFFLLELFLREARFFLGAGLASGSAVSLDASVSGASGGLVSGGAYLWRMQSAGGDFGPLWARGRTGERQALVDLLTLVRRRRRRYPGMHIYH